MEWIAIGIAVVSAVGTLGSFLVQHGNAKKQEDANSIAAKAEDAAREAATAAQRSADVAEKSLEIQESEARAVEEQRRHLLSAELEIEAWSGREGLIVRNLGEAPAKNVVAYCVNPDRNVTRSSSVSSIPPRESRGIHVGWGSTSLDDVPSDVPRGTYKAMVQWTDALDEHQSAWTTVSKG